MVIAKEILTDYKEIYEKAVKLVDDESKNDPADEPYRSHYAARDLLLEMKENLQNARIAVKAEQDSENTESGNSLNEDVMTYTVLQAFICRDLGKIYIFTEETSLGEKLLKECVDLTEKYKLQPEAIIAYMAAMNELGIVYSNRSEHQKAYEMLVEAEQCYKEFKKSLKNALSITDLFGTRAEIEQGKGLKEFEGLYTLCCFYLAQVYGHLEELEKSAQYCHETLKRQIEAKSYEPIDFALNAATLSQYFIGQHMFKEARHHLAAATLIIGEYEVNINAENTELTTEEKLEMQENFKHRYADVARCWSKYGICLLSASKERLFNDDDEKLANDVKHINMHGEDFYTFQGLELDTFEKRISCDYCLTFDDAKDIYHLVIKWLDLAKEYYKPDTEASEYAKIIKDYAELYEYMAFFEEDPINQAKMHKRRAKYYEELIELLNPTYYLGICRACWYGAGLAYTAILDIKLDCFKANATPNPQELHKINLACQLAIKNFMDYVNSYCDKDNQLKMNINVEEQRTLLYVYFHLGRLHYKLITPEAKLQLENLTNSLKYYRMFTDQCEKQKEAAKTLQAEIGVCREMVNLLPMKMQNVRKRLGK